MPSPHRALAPVLVVCATLFAFFVSLSVLRPATAQAPTAQTAIAASTDAALHKLTPDLREAAKVGGDHVLTVRVEADRAVDLTPYAVRAFARPPTPLGDVTLLAQVKVGALTKLAALPGVLRVEALTTQRTAAPPAEMDAAPRASLEQRRARLSQLRAVDRGWDATNEVSKTSKTESWYDILSNHETRRAWAKGYRGEGVKVAVIDDGVDMAHPDLVDTWATVTDTGSPYFGWPMAFDPFSLWLYVNDANLDTPFVAAGYTWYADTSHTPTVERTAQDIQNQTARVSFAPFAYTEGRGGKVPGTAHTYLLPDRSASGVYRLGSHPDMNLAALHGQFVALLLADEQTSGVYDTVYVDLDNDYDFTDEKPVTRSSPASYRDVDGDGLTDLSGGMVYFIADGATQIPGGFLWGELAPPPASGALVAFMGSFDEANDHGTLCASNVVAQGRINGAAPRFADLPGDGRPGGVVRGAAPNASLIPIGNAYWDFFASTRDAYLFSLLGYDGRPNTADDIQITSNSYGSSDIDNDGWDFQSRYIDRYVRRLNPTLSHLDSTGNGGAGYGTNSPASPSVGIGVGASTQWGSVGRDSITRTSQIVYGEVIPWSNRGPSAIGGAGVDIVADGAFASGNVPVNYVLDGSIAWEIWGGTSRSSPVAAGNLALVYQAFREKHGRWPRYDEARALLKSGAITAGQDVLIQGTGRVNADRSTDIASGRFGVYAMPDEWRPGDYRGQQYPAFAQVIYPGQSDSQSFRLINPSSRPVDVRLSATVQRRFASREFAVTSRPIGEESPYNYNTPDYLVALPDLPITASLMAVSLIFPLEQLDPDANYTADSNWRLLIYNWTDINGDGKLWEDRNGNGVVNHTNKTPFEPHDIMGSPALDWSQTEIQQWEYTRITMGYPTGNSLAAFVRDPGHYAPGALLLGMQHQNRSDDVPTTTFKIKIDFYEEVEWPWVSFADETLTAPPGGVVTTTATISIPAGVAAGAYPGSIRATYAGKAPYHLFLPHLARQYQPGAMVGKDVSPTAPAAGAALVVADRVATIPVVASVGARFDFSNSLTLGGAAAQQPNAQYNNGVVRGAFDWAWRAESGDWRFFFIDMTQAPPEGTSLLTRNVWDDEGPPTDIDTRLLGPTSDRFSDPANPDNQPPNANWAEPAYFGPYTLDMVGASVNANARAGVWRFDTATGGPEEWVTAPAQAGLHSLLLHNVLSSGARFSVPFTTTVGTVSVRPTAFNITATVTTGDVVSDCLPLTFRSSLDLPGVAAAGYGLSKPQTYPNEVIHQDDPDDPSTASYTRTLTLDHAATLDIHIDGGDGPDLDLFLLYDANDDSVFSYPDEVIASSTTATAQESVSLRLPEDGAYQVWVHGWSVPGGQATFALHVDAVQGRDLTVRNVPSGPLAANTPADLEVCYSKSMAPGEEYKGEVLLGPSVAPGTLSVPVTIRRAATSAVR